MSPGTSAADAARALGLSVTASGTRLLDDVSLQVPAGALTWFVGASGAGKTTLLETMAGLNPQGVGVSGAVEIAGHPARPGTWSGRRSLARWRSEGLIGWAPQNAADTFPPHLRLTAWLSPGEATREFGLTDEMLGRFPHELSGGQVARVSLAAALAREPAVLFVDEPTAGLEPELAASVMDVLARVAGTGTAVVASTHDLEAVERMLTTRDAGLRVRSTTVVLRGGRVVESLDSSRFLAGAADTEYARAFVLAMPTHGAVPLPAEFDDDLHTTEGPTPGGAGRHRDEGDA